MEIPIQWSNGRETTFQGAGKQNGQLYFQHPVPPFFLFCSATTGSKKHKSYSKFQGALAQVGVLPKVKKTKCMFFNHHVDPVGNFKYLGSQITDSEHYFKVRKASPWIASNKMRKVWTPKLSRATKIRLFRATVELLLLYGSETWTMTKNVEKSVNGCYTRMLRMALNVHWQQHIMNQELYNPQEKIKISWPLCSSQ